MRSIMCLAIAAVLAAGIGIAKADVYSYTTSVSGLTSDVTQDTYFQPASFNRSFGHLTGVSLAFSGTLAISDLILVTSVGTPPQPGSYFKTSATIIGEGFSHESGNDYNPDIATTPFTIGARYATAQEQAAVTFNVASQAIDNYVGDGTTNSSLFGFVEFNSIPEMPNGNFYGNQTFPNATENVFTGQLTETFTYQPVGVPEPGSLALLGTSGLMLAGALKLIRRRKS